nr:HAD-IA family hydrolase [Flavonifractor plautii]
MFIVSNCQDGYIEAFFQAHGLGKFFKDYENPGRTGKPKGDNIALVVQRNGLKKPLYIGDTQGDYNAATQAGVPFLHAAYGFGHIDREVPHVDAFADIPAAVKRLSPP